MTEKTNEDLRVAVVGLGPIGRSVAQALDQGIPGYTLTAVSVSAPSKHSDFLSSFRNPPAICAIEKLTGVADVVIECAPSHLVDAIVGPFVRSGKVAIVLSASALLDHMDLVDAAGENRGQIIVPTGALLGLDAVAAAKEGQITSVRMVTSKPVTGLAGAPYFTQNNISISEITEPTKIFEGSAREAAKGFPANLNVAVALSLAGVGPDLTTLEIWADPSLTRNRHHIAVESDAASFSMTIENIPTDNPKTGRITAQSVIACLRKQHAPLRVGT